MKNIYLFNGADGDMYFSTAKKAYSYCENIGFDALPPYPKYLNDLKEFDVCDFSKSDSGDYLTISKRTLN